MTGPEHYQEAEKLLGYAGEYDTAQKSAAQMTAAAQVHATLALAAAIGVTAETEDQP
jgi:hypothetical protein